MITVLCILEILIAIVLILSILGQNSKSAGLSGTIAGGAETFFGKKRGLDDKLARLTAILAVAFFVIAIVVALLMK